MSGDVENTQHQSIYGNYIVDASMEIDWKKLKCKHLHYINNTVDLGLKECDECDEMK